MKKSYIIALAAIVLLGIVSSPVWAADFGPIFPKQGQDMVSPPNLTWATGEYDFFVLMILVPIPGHWYQPIAIPRVKSYFLMPELWWNAMITEGWGLWAVVGMNTTTWDYGFTPWQCFRKVNDCVVEFPDPEVEIEIREKIRKPAGPILASDLREVTSFSGDSDEISSIAGLEYCTNLLQLSLHENPLLSDIDSLAGLINLTELDLVNNPIEDLSPLAGLVDLVYLDLENNNISDLQPLAGLVNLSELDLYGNEIAEASSLAELVNLEKLKIGHNRISEIGFLSGLGELWFVDLNHNQIEDLSPLAGMSTLTHLYLHGNRISDLSPLADLTNLGGLYLDSNEITDIGPLAGLSNLGSLSLSKNQIVDIGPLAGLTQLQWLFLDRNEISDIGALPLGGFLEVDLDGNQISDVYRLVENPYINFMTQIYLADNPLSFGSCYVYIPELESRGVMVLDDCG